MIATTEPRLHVPAPFRPRRWLANGHAMTLYAWGRRRSFPALPAHVPRLFQVAADTQVLAQCFWQPLPRARPTLLALHGLESSSDVHYMRGLADKAWRRGWNAVLLNQRNCGGTEALTPGLYHSGLTEDPLAVLRILADEGHGPFGVVGYSLGGNLAMKLAAELGDEPSLPVLATVGVSPIIDIDACVRAIERPVNIAYQWNFVRNLQARMRRKAAAWPGAFDLTPLSRIRTIRQFDDVYTAPYYGFGDAANYYRMVSAKRVIDRIRIPALILAAADDPFVPPAQFRTPEATGNPGVIIRVERHGGHCGFVSHAVDGYDGYWAEKSALDFLASVIEPSRPDGPGTR